MVLSPSTTPQKQPGAVVLVMCGIAVYAERGKRGSETASRGKEIVEASLAKLRHRGPDGSGVLVVPVTDEDQSVILGHTRLSIVGNGDAAQPLRWSNGSSRFHLVHNGEVYNWRELRARLIAEGHCKGDDFKTEGDSEVLMACLAHRGIDWTLREIRGMFAFVFVESQITGNHQHLKKIILARDEFGIKPLQFAMDVTREKLFVCSEFLAMPDDIELRDHRDVLPSSFVEVSIELAGGQSVWSVCEHPHGTLRALEPPIGKSSISLDETLSVVRSRLMDAVSVRIPEGVPMAILLSGGLDSSLICRLAADIIYPETLHTFTAMITEEADGSSPRDSDCHFAAIVAQDAPNVVHEVVTISFQDCLKTLPNVVECMESTDVAMIRAGVPLYLLSKHIAARGFKVILCGEGADESMAGYRLFEDYSAMESERFSRELKRRLFNIDTSELQRVDRCTMAHGLEARVPFMDVDYVKATMDISTKDKMTHPALGRIQKYILRRAFDGKYYQSKVTKRQLVPDSVLYREKEQFSDGVGRAWITKLQAHSSSMFPGLSLVEAECALYKRYQEMSGGGEELDGLIQSRKERRSQRAQDGNPGKPGRSQPARWHPVGNDADLSKLNLSREDALLFLQRVLSWAHDDVLDFSPNLEALDKIIVSMLERIPFHNLTLLTRQRRPPTMDEIKRDMFSGIGGPCAVVNSFFAVLLDRLGFGPHVYLLSCEINQRSDCHVAILLQFKGRRFFVDVANAKPYNQAAHLGDSSTFTTNGFKWGLRYNDKSGLMMVHHSDEKAMSFNPSVTVPYSSFRAMIKKSRSDTNFGPFLTGLRFVLYPYHNASQIIACRDACIYDGNGKHCAASKKDIQSVANQPPFSKIDGLKEMVHEAITVLDKEHPGWFERSRELLLAKGVPEVNWK